MNNATLLSIAALAVSVISSVWTIIYNRLELRAQTLGLTEATFIPVEQMLAKVPTALRFHGITDDDLYAYNITSAEFAYLLSNFTAGGIFHRQHSLPKDTPFSVDSYRGVLLQSVHTRRAWPLLKRCIAPTVYRDRIEATIKIIDDLERAATAGNTSAVA